MKSEFASPSQRFVALAYDLIIIFVPIMLLAVDIVLLAVSRKVPKAFADIVPALSIALFTTAAFLYFTLSSVSRRQATVGQRIIGIHVAGAEMGKLSLGKSTLHYAPLGILMILQQLFLNARDLPSLARGSIVHIAATVCWCAIALSYFYSLVDSQKASVFDRLLSVRVYRNEVPNDYTLPKVQVVVALAFLILSVLPLFKNLPLYGFLLSFLAILAGGFVYGYRNSETRPLGKYFKNFVAFQPVLLITLLPSLLLVILTWGLVLK